MIDAPLVLERQGQANETALFGNVMLAPPVTEDYWTYRVVVGEHQAIVGFPKFFTVGVGFAVEEDWNTNLPYSCPTEMIWQHIRHNKGDERIPDDRCVQAIRMVQEAATADAEQPC